MIFRKKTWKDRVSEFPTRRTLTKSDGSSELVTVSRSEGDVSQEGDAFSAATMNDLEGRIDEGFTALNNDLTDSSTGKSFRFGVTDDGRPGCWWPNEEGGADTVIPFSDDSACIILPQKYKIRTQMGARIFYPTALSDVFYNMSVCAYPLGTVKKFKINIDLQGIEGSFIILWYGNDGNIIHKQSYTVKNQHIEVSTDDYEDTVAIGLGVENSTFTTNVEVFPITN